MITIKSKNFYEFLHYNAFFLLPITDFDDMNQYTSFCMSQSMK